MQLMLASYRAEDTPALVHTSKLELELSVHKPEPLPACAVLHQGHHMLFSRAVAPAEVQTGSAVSKQPCV